MKKLAFSLLLVYLVILPLIDQLNYKIYGKIGYDNLFMSIIFFLCIISVLLSSKHKIGPLTSNIFFIGFVFLYLIGSFLPTFSSFLFGKQPNPHQLTMGLRFIQMVVILLVLDFLIKDWLSFKKVLIAYIMGAIIAAFFGFGQALNIGLFWDIADKYYLIGRPHLSVYIRRIKMVSFWPESGNTFGSYMVMSLLLILGMGSLFLKKTFRWAMVFLTGVIISLSYTSIIAMIIGFCSLIFVSAKKKMIIKKSYIKGAFFVSVLVILLALVFSERMATRVRSYLRFGGENTLLISGLNGRLEMWSEFWGFIRERSSMAFLLGKGYAFSGIADNYYIELLAAGGLISLSFFVLILGSLFIFSFERSLFYKNKIPRLYYINRTILIMITALAVMLLTGSYFSYLPTVFPLLILVVGAKNFKYFRERQYVKA